MSRVAFADTSFWIALFDARDSRHREAAQAFRARLRESHLVLSDFVIFETITYLNCSVKRHDLAMKYLGAVESSGLKILVVEDATKARSVELFQKVSDKHLSFTDCTSFALMEREGIREYVGFDDHFTQMGFRPAVGA